MPIRMRELNHVPALGFETKKVNALSCHYRHSQASNKHGLGMEKYYQSFKTESFALNFCRILSYIPISGSIFAAIQLNTMAERNGSRNKKS